jgi:hypothetical protein
MNALCANATGTHLRIGAARVPRHRRASRRFSVAATREAGRACDQVQAPRPPQGAGPTSPHPVARARTRSARSRAARSWWRWPEAVASIRRKMRSPAASTVSLPSTMPPQSMSMSSCCFEPQRGVGGQLQAGRRRAAVGRPAAGGEADQVGAAGHLAGGRHRVVARRVHVDEAAGGDGSANSRPRRPGGAALGDGAQALLQDGGQPAGLVAGRRVVVHLHAVARGVGLPPARCGPAACRPPLG